MLKISDIKLRLSSVAPLIILKLTQYVEILDRMDSNNGWYPFPGVVIEYFEELGVVHWAELYFQECSTKGLQDSKDKVGQLNQLITNQVGNNPSKEAAEVFLNKLVEVLVDSDKPIKDLEFLETTPDPTFVTHG